VMKKAKKSYDFSRLFINELRGEEKFLSRAGFVVSLLLRR